MTALPVGTQRTVRTASRGQESMLVVDHHPVVREGFRHIAGKLGIGRVLEAADIVAGYDVFYSQRPRLVVTDLYFEEDGLSGLTLIRRIRTANPAARILVFSMHDDPILVAHALRVGAGGFVVKHASITILLEALAEVRAGRGYLPHEIATLVAMLDLRDQPAPLASLTARELQILSLVGQGKSYPEIAKKIPIKYRRLISEISNVRAKVGAKNIFDLIQFAQSHKSLGL
ncbi:response regulator transcription factor [Methylobacterium mesophilicum SR1.6/6]|uniref:Response regulator transcription factor n=2 Tax=Methylobacterium mesophilicum TaxID=39956 RepID=A0A6B9F9A5_9HYPH|nr:response regulator transcription factor [Methylobacterium mesophilicum SR1.6/6]